MAGKQIVSPSGKPKTLAAVHPNAGLTAEYQRKLDRLIEGMHRSLVYWLKAQYRETPPEMAQDDDGPAVSLRSEMHTLGQRWLDRFDEAAPELARYFATAASQRADGALAAILRRAGISVRFKPTPTSMDVFRGVLGENVSLIKSIAQEHLSDVEQMVMRSVTVGRDVGGMVKELEARYAITRRRAALISRDQNAKATAVITRVRQRELGMTEAVWLHSAGGRHPRESHVAMSGKRYNIDDGVMLDSERVWPGTAINCRCVSKAIVPGFS